METESVTTKDEFVDIVTGSDDPNIDLSKAATEELWHFWMHRYENGATDDYLVGLPNWLCQDKFDARRPFFFGTVEYDDESSDAILFADVRTVDKSILEARMWTAGQVDVAELLTDVDNSDDEDSYVDEPGLTWSPRSQHIVFQYTGDGE